MCIDFKIAKNANKDKNKVKYELGTFCEQYGLPPIAPSRRHKHVRKDKKYPSHKRRNNQDDYYKPTSHKRKRFTKFNNKAEYKPKNDITCFTCGNKGHISKDCRVKNKLKQLKISSEDREQIFKLLRAARSNSNSDSQSQDSDEPGSDIPTSSSENEENSDSESPDVTIGCSNNCTSTCCNKHVKKINVLTKDNEEKLLLIDLIAKISDPDL